MKHINIARHRSFFAPVLQSSSLQAAVMALKPGQASSEEVENEHPKAEQWLYVISGEGTAIVGRKRQALKTGSLLLIEKREAHQVRNTGDETLVTLNFYCPPAYAPSGDVKPAMAR